MKKVCRFSFHSYTSRLFSKWFLSLNLLDDFIYVFLFNVQKTDRLDIECYNPYEIEKIK